MVPFSRNGTPEFAFIACHQRHAPLMLTHLPPFPLHLLFVASCYTRRVLAAKSSGIFIRGDRGQHKSNRHRGKRRETRSSFHLLGARELVNFSRPCCPPGRGTNGEEFEQTDRVTGKQTEEKVKILEDVVSHPFRESSSVCKELFRLEFSSLNERTFFAVYSCSRKPLIILALNEFITQQELIVSGCLFYHANV